MPVTFCDLLKSYINIENSAKNISLRYIYLFSKFLYSAEMKAAEQAAAATAAAAARGNRGNRGRGRGRASSSSTRGTQRG